MSDRSGNGDYEVGYRKPPKHSRFRKGQSGNPKGRPKGAKSAGTMLREIFYRKVTITEDGQRKTTTALEAFFLRVMKEALRGDPRSADKLLKLLPLLQDQFDRDAARAEADHAETLRDDGPMLQAVAELLGVSAEDLFLTAQVGDRDAG